MNKARPSRLHPQTPSSYEVPGRNLCPYGDTLHIRWVAGRRRYRDDLVEPGGTPPQATTASGSGGTNAMTAVSWSSGSTSTPPCGDRAI